MAQRLLTPESSNIFAIEYNEVTSVLTVEFKEPSGQKAKTYDFENVSKEAWDKFSAAQSKGKYFSREIRPSFKGKVRV